MITARTARRNIYIAVAVAVALAIIYWPVLRWMVNSWISSDYYSHGFLIPVVSAIVVWIKRDVLRHKEPSSMGIYLIVSGAIFYPLSFLWQMRVLGALSLIIILGGLLLAIWGTRAFRTLLFPWVFLLFMVPFWFIQDIAYRLQYLSVNWGSAIASVLGLPIVTSGNEIHLGSIAFTVGIVCSGINTLVALLALAAVYAYILKGPSGARYGLFLLAIPIAIAANVLRIASIILVAYFFNVETATGWYHDLSSPLFFFLAFGVILLCGRLLKCRINYGLLSR
jgi:exosortase